jgi:hypothetical protein
MSEDKEDLDAYEARQIIGPDSYDDNYNLRRYTSELRDNNTGRFIAFVDFNENEGTIRECPHCLEYEIHNKLGPKILKKGEKPAPDHDQFMQCHSCGTIYPIYQTYPESEIKDSLETTTDPFEESASVFLSVGKRKFKNKLDKYQYDNDPDIKAEQKRVGSDNVHIIQ